MAERKFTYDRFFGDNIESKVRKKLDARQRLQKGRDFGKSTDFDSAGTPYLDGDGKSSGPDLSQRIPWARMWTAVETYELNPSWDELKELSKDPAEMSKWKYETKTNNIKIFSIGNQTFRDYEENGSTGSVVGGLLQNNEFLKPNAGITSVETTTSGYMGAVTETIVNFKIFNYSDWENIFVPYFMVPGATVFVDWGWNTSEIYNPVELMEGLDESNSGAVVGDFEFNSFREKMWGLKDGKISKSNGDLNVERGRVTKFNSSVDSDGSFNCYITIVSENYALIDYDQTTGISFPTIFEDVIAVELMAKVKEEYGIDISDDDVVGSDKIKRLLPLYVGPRQQFSFMGEEGPRFVAISDKALEAGIFYRPLDEVVVDDINKSISGLSTGKQTYITFKKFGQLLNHAIGLEYVDGEISQKKVSPDSIHYDFEFGEVTFNSQLYARQVFQNKLNKQLTFMYPTKITQRNFEEEVSTSTGEIIYTETTEDVILNTADNMAKVKSVPVAQMWINLPLIYKAFKKHTGVKAAVDMIFEEINKDSLGIFNIRLKDRSPNSFSATDSNFTTPPGSSTESDSATQPEDNENNSSPPSDNVEDIFTFSVFSPNTIVNSLDLQMTMENNALANKIAIQGMNAGSLVYPLSDQLKKDLAVKDINSGADTGNLFVRHVPTQDQDADVKFMKNTLAESKTKEDEELDKIAKQQSKEIETSNLTLLFDIPNSPWKQVEEKTKSEQAVAPVEYERANKENPELEDPEVEGDFPEDLYVGSISNYFNLKMLGKSIDDTKFQDIILPYTVTLSIYGIQGIFPGNKFRIDYLPKRYRQKTYFVVMKINHSLTQQGWITTITGQMRFYGEKKLDNTILYNPNIHVSKKKLWNMGYTEEQIVDLRDSKKQFWTVVPKFANKTASCLDPIAMNYKAQDSKFKWDCSGVRNGDDLKCCQYCPDGRSGTHETGWRMSDDRQMCKNDYGKEILNPYLDWEDTPSGYEFKPGQGWVKTENTTIEESSSSSSSTDPVALNGICKDTLASNYGFTTDWRWMPKGDHTLGSQEECEVDSNVNGGLKPKCCHYLTPEEMDQKGGSKFATITETGVKVSPWADAPQIYYWGYSGGWKSTWGGNNYMNGNGGHWCEDYDSGCDYCCAYGHCACNGFEGTNTAPGQSCSDYLWQGGSKDRGKFVNSWSKLLTSTVPRGIKKSYEESNAGKILDIIDSVSYCYDTTQKNSRISDTVGNSGSEMRWWFAQYRACCANNPDCAEYSTWSQIHGMGPTSTNGNYMTVFKKKAAAASLPEDISVIVNWAEEHGDAPDGNGWGTCNLFSDMGNVNEQATSNKQDQKRNFGGDCWGPHTYPCPDESCCNW